jgi:hypothetical protein
MHTFSLQHDTQLKCHIKYFFNILFVGLGDAGKMHQNPPHPCRGGRLGDNVKTLFLVTDGRIMKLEYLSLASLLTVVKCLRVRPGKNVVKLFQSMNNECSY